MIDPIHITDYERGEASLEELLLFCIAVAGKNAIMTANSLEKLLKYGRKNWKDGHPFEVIRAANKTDNLAEVMKNVGFGCYNLKSKGFMQAAKSGLNLKKCSVDELEALYGVGMKTARFFILHTRKNARVACLDTHVLNWLSYYTGYSVPETTPSRKKYLELEKVFLKIADVMNISPADLDLKIWNKQRGSDEESLAKGTRAKEKLLDG
jgi:thermostable 8-oxoguanine DNA glycosylase